MLFALHAAARREHLLLKSARAGQVALVPERDGQVDHRPQSVGVHFAQHTADPFCASCHAAIDPVGFGFEGFDAVGRTRTTENGVAIDDHGDMVDIDGIGTHTSSPFTSMAQLADTLATSRTAEACFVQQLGRFALGRELDADERCLLANATDAFVASDGDLRTALLEVIRAPAFTMRRAP